MNPRVVVSVVVVAVTGAVKLISKFRNRDNDTEEDEESGSSNQSESGQESTTTGGQQFESEKQKASWEAHEQATNRRPPVELGEVRDLGVEEIITHHSGTQTARGKIEGFQVFVKDVPPSVRSLDIIQVKITSYGRGRTSAEGRFMGYA